MSFEINKMRNKLTWLSIIVKLIFPETDKINNECTIRKTINKFSRKIHALLTFHISSPSQFRNIGQRIKMLFINEQK